MVKLKTWNKALLEFCRPIKVQSLSLQTLPPAPSRPASTQDAETKDSEMVDGSIFPFYHYLIFFRHQPNFYSLVKILSYLEKSIIKWRYWSRPCFGGTHLHFQVCVVKGMIFFFLCSESPEESSAILRILKNIGQFVPNFHSYKTLL